MVGDISCYFMIDFMRVGVFCHVDVFMRCQCWCFFALSLLMFMQLVRLHHLQRPRLHPLPHLPLPLLQVQQPGKDK